MPKVSVIIPSFNNGQFIVEAVSSVLNQTFNDVEIIVIDDGSTDNTEDQLGHLFDSITYVRQKNQGAPSARNRGMEIATGQYIAFLDSDDIWDANNLFDKIKVLEEHPDISLVFSDFSMILEDGSSVPYAMQQLYPIFRTSKKSLDVLFEDIEDRITKSGKATQLYKGNVFSALLQGNFINLCSVVLRRSVLESTGTFNRQLITQQDYDLWIRIARNHTFAFIDESLVEYRQHANQLTAKRHTVRINNTVISILQPYYDNRHRILSPGLAQDFEHRFADSHVQLGLALMGDRKPDLARTSFWKAIKFAPVRPYRLAIWLFSLLPPIVTHDAVKGVKRLIRN